VNRVHPSLIRVEADEATYNLHIMLRYEVEKALVNGEVAVGDLPQFWNSRMEKYLGIIPPNDAQGVLQDIHWSMGAIGYFPTYSLGNLYAAQLWEATLRDLPDLSQQIAAGKTEPLLEWMRSHIHVHGSRWEPEELVQRASGAEPGAEAFVRYLKTKFGALYGLA
jgi:carboxypeptidase Taq